MRIVTLTEHISVDFWRPIIGCTYNFEAGKPYLISDNHLRRINEWHVPTPFEKISDAAVVFRPFSFREEGPKGSVLIYNGVGGLGDQIMTWPIAKILADRGYEVHVLTEPHLELFWQGFPWIRSIILLPCYWSFLDRFDHHLIFEYISNSYVHDEQMQPIDAMLRIAGIDPAMVPASEKCITPTFTSAEIQISDNLYPDRRLGFYQLSASQQARSLAPEHSRAILRALAETFPDIYWIAVYGPLEKQEYWDPPFDLPNVEFRSFQRARIIWALARRAEICVGPDSMLVHVAGMLGRPCIGMWGSYAPDSRVKYYRNHHAIFHREFCPHSPCNWNSYDLPHFCPPSQLPRKRCEVLLRIEPSEVVELARQILSQEKHADVFEKLPANLG